MHARKCILCRHGVDQPAGVPLLPGPANLNLIEGDFGYCSCIARDMPRRLNAAARGRDCCAVPAILSRLEFPVGNGPFLVTHDAWLLGAMQTGQAQPPEILHKWGDLPPWLQVLGAVSAGTGVTRQSLSAGPWVGPRTWLYSKILRVHSCALAKSITQRTRVSKEEIPT